LCGNIFGTRQYTLSFLVFDALFCLWRNTPIIDSHYSLVAEL
jgi:hypothetical protein